MENTTDNKARTLLKRFFQRYFVDAMSAMALGLFSSLIIGLIMSQLSMVPFLTFLAPYSEMAAASSPVVGSAIGAAIAWGLKAKPLVVFSCVVCGAFGYQAGGPVGDLCGCCCRRGTRASGQWKNQGRHCGDADALPSLPAVLPGSLSAPISRTL
ncbi:PTS sugar transporter subunit IIC [Anaeromassilibacillus sp. SJQ-1]|uniref:PTS sugar transporter subunit IIC n=1 Tax=Anaeromassilibacillus sp. SJQ-1 TaxID=3375419 RepID=UPI003988B2DF